MCPNSRQNENISSGIIIAYDKTQIVISIDSNYSSAPDFHGDDREQ